MARRGVPLAYLPERRPVYEDDIDTTPHEKVRLVAGYLIGSLIVAGFIVLMSLAGPQ